MPSKAKRHAHHSRSSAKERAFWFSQRAAFPLRDTPPAELERYWASQTIADITSAHQWDCAGPFNIAGRVTSLVVHPRDPQRWFAGSAAGGVWMSTDSGISWTPTWSPFLNQNIGALAWWNPRGDQWCLVAATGEANMSNDSYPGSGMYFSSDDGLTWQPLFGTPRSATQKAIEQDVQTFPRRIGWIAIHGPQMFAIGSVSHDDHMPAGLYRITSSGSLAPCRFWGNRKYNCHCVLFHPQDPNRMIASVEPGGTRNGIWTSHDGGNHWEHLTRGLPPGDEFRRTSLAFAPSDPDVIYAVSSDRANALLGVFRSTNGGKSWKQIFRGSRAHETQMSYNNTLAVHPSKPDRMIWGGSRLYLTDNGGKRWRVATLPDRGAPNYVHSDHHAVLWLDEDRILSGNDGGVSLSEDRGRTWTERSSRMVTTMFYDVDVAPTNANVFGGGSQDNGTLITGIRGFRDGEFDRALGGDGGWICFDAADDQHIFGSSTSFFVYRHRRGKPWKLVRPKGLPPEETQARSLIVLAMEQSSKRGVKTVWAGSTRLWKTIDDGDHWRPSSPTFDGSPISAIEIAGTKGQILFAGTTNGGIFRSRDGGVTWSQNLAETKIPQHAITSIQVHPRRPRTVAFSVASTGILSSGVELGTGTSLPFGHVFLSDDLGDTWTDIDRGALPNVVYYAAAWQTQRPHYLFVAGDAGVFALVNDTWMSISGNLPSVVISDLVYHAGSRTLTAATYGRGLWRLRVAKLRPPKPRRKDTDAQASGAAAGLREDQRVAPPVIVSPKDGAVFNVYPRKTVVTLRPVRLATGYQVEWVFGAMQSGFTESSATPKVEFEFVGAQPGRFRVWALLPNGMRSRQSEWRDFRYLQ